MKRCAAFVKLVVDGKEIGELIPLEKRRANFVLPAAVLEKLQLKGITITDPTDHEVYEYLQAKWG